jgi:hypothetical protein
MLGLPAYIRIHLANELLHKSGVDQGWEGFDSSNNHILAKNLPCGKVLFHWRRSDKYISATAMCRSAHMEPSNYRRVAACASGS